MTSDDPSPQRPTFSPARESAPGVKPASRPIMTSMLDITLGVGELTYSATAAGVRTLWRLASPLAGRLSAPTALPPQVQPDAVAARIAEQGSRLRRSSEARLRETILDVSTHLVEAVLPRIALDRVLGQLDLSEALESVDIGELLDHVDKEQLVAHLPIALILESIDVNQIADRIDLDRAAERINIEAILARVNLDAVADRIDLDRAAKRIDIEAILARVDVDDVVARADLQRIITRLDLVGLVREILEAIDLPAIIRESTGTMASDAVSDVRWQAMSADQAVNSAFARLRGHGRRPNHGQTALDADGRPSEGACP